MYSVLYVDDESTLLQIAQIYLERTGEFLVSTAESAEEGLEKLAAAHYDAVVSDYQMPDMDGIAFLQTLRSQGDETPFIIFTGKGREEVVIQALNSGADFYLQKGGDPTAQFAELVHKIKRAIQDRISRIQMLEIVEGSPIPKFVINRGHRVIFWNRALEEYSGIAAADIVGTMDHWKAFYDHQRPCLADLIVDDNIDGIVRWYSGKQEKSSIVTGAYQATDYFPRIKGGTWLFFTAAPLHDTGGEIIGAIETLQDITSLRKKEEELRAAYEQTQSALERARESEQRYHNVVEYQTEFICRFRPDGTHIFANRAYCRYFNRSCDAIIGHRFVPDIPLEDQERVKKHFSSLTRENPSGTIEHRIIMPDGEVRWQQWSDRAIFDENGTLVEYQSVGRDITGRKKAEEQLRAEHELAMALNSALTLGDVLPFCLSIAIRLSGMDSGGIYLVSGISGDLELACSSGLSDDFVREISCIRSDSDSACLVYTGRPVYSQHGKLGVPITGARAAEKLRAIAVIPILARGRIIGCFNIASHILDIVPDESRTILEAVAAQIGNGIIRLKAEESTWESEIRFRELADLLPQTVYEIDITGRITYANRFGLEQFGYSEEELHKGLNVAGMIHPDDRERALRNIRKILNGERSVGNEYQAMRRDGTIFPVIIYGDRVIRENRAVGLRGIVADITEQKKAEYALRESEERLRLAIDAAHAGIWEWDLEPNKNQWSEEIWGLYGLEPHSCEPSYEGRRMSIHPDDREKAEQAVREAARTGTELNAEWRVNTGNGTERWLMSRGRPLRDPDGGITRYSGIVIDITGRKRAEAALHEAGKKLKILSSITRHDILNKISALQGYHELIHHCEDREEVLELLEKEEATIEAITQQIEFTREYERLGVDAPQWQRVRDTAARAVSQFDLRGIRFTNDIRNLEVYADAMLEKVFYNLTDNALRFGEKVTRIRISSRKAGVSLIIVYADNGVGIPVGEKENIFERGYGRHNGLGLFLVREILSITGMTITETGRPEEGARFEIMVPAGAFRSA